MAYLTINGMEPRAADIMEDEDGVIEDGRGVTGRAFHDRQALKRRFSLALVPQLFAHADAWRRLLEGRGHTFSFDSTLFSAKGLGPLTGNEAIITTNADGVVSKYGTSYCDTQAAALEYSLIGYQSWTFSVWAWNGTAWELRQQTSDGVQLLGGVEGSYAWDYAPSGLGTTSSPHIFTLPPGGKFDGLVILPFALPSDLLVQWSSYTLPWPALPHLYLSGDATNGEVYEVVIEGGVKVEHETDAVPPHMIVSCDVREV